ncbi:hypothetical protein V1507DRAFT_467938 [Lipomyces tetrasporus]
MSTFDDDDLFTDLYADDDSAPIADVSATTASNLATRSADLNGHPAETRGSTYAEAPLPLVEIDKTHRSDSYDVEDSAELGDDEGAAQRLAADRSETEEYSNQDDVSKEDGKMFIGGLNWDTTDETLFKYFSQFGEVTECQIMREATTGRSRGFAFLTFKDSKCVNTVMVKEHILDGKIIDPKRAIPKEEQEKTSKIFVGGVSPLVTEAEFRNVFSRFGRILDCSLMIDKDTGRSRGFGFITFESDSGVDNTLANCPLMIGGKMVEVKKAQPRGRDEYGANDSHRQQYANYDEDYSSQQDQSGQGFNGDLADPFYANGMTPSMLAKYWHRMQAYVVALQQIQASGMNAFPAYSHTQGYGPEAQVSVRNSQAQPYYPGPGRAVYDAPRFSDSAVGLSYEDENAGDVAHQNKNSKPIATGSVNDRLEASAQNDSKERESLHTSQSTSTILQRQTQQSVPDSEAKTTVTEERQNTPDGTNVVPQAYQSHLQNYSNYQPNIPSGPRSYRSQYQVGVPPTGPRQGGYMYNRGRGSMSRGRGGYVNRGSASGYFPYAR